MSQSSNTSSPIIKLTKLQKIEGNINNKKSKLADEYNKLLQLLRILGKLSYVDASIFHNFKLSYDDIKKRDIYDNSKSSFYKRLPKIKSNMTNQEIQNIIESQKKKMIQYALRGQNPEFDRLMKELEKKNKTQLTKNNIISVKKLKNKLLTNHKQNPIKVLVDTESIIEKMITKNILPHKQELERLYIKKQAQIKKDEQNKKNKQAQQEKRDALRDQKKKEKEQAKENLKKQKKIEAEQKKKEARDEKERERIEHKNRKQREKNAREKAKQAIKKRKHQAKEEKKAAKRVLNEAQNAIKQAARQQQLIIKPNFTKKTLFI